MTRDRCNVGDVIAIYRYETRKNREPAGIGVVLKVYDENRCFVKLLRNFSIPEKYCKPWRKFGVNEDGYYVRREDMSKFLYSTTKVTYQVSPTRTYATKQICKSHDLRVTEIPAFGYLKTIPGSKTEVYMFDVFDEVIPKFVLMKDVDSGVVSIVVQRFSDETLTEMARKAHAKIQMLKLEKLVR